MERSTRRRSHDSRRTVVEFVVAALTIWLVSVDPDSAAGSDRGELDHHTLAT